MIPRPSSSVWLTTKRPSNLVAKFVCDEVASLLKRFLNGTTPKRVWNYRANELFLVIPLGAHYYVHKLQPAGKSNIHLCSKKVIKVGNRARISAISFEYEWWRWAARAAFSSASTSTQRERKYSIVLDHLVGLNEGIFFCNHDNFLCLNVMGVGKQRRSMKRSSFAC